MIDDKVLKKSTLIRIKKHIEKGTDLSLNLTPRELRSLFTRKELEKIDDTAIIDSKTQFKSLRSAFNKLIDIPCGDYVKLNKDVSKSLTPSVLIYWGYRFGISTDFITHDDGAYLFKMGLLSPNYIINSFIEETDAILSKKANLLGYSEVNRTIRVPKEYDDSYTMFAKEILRSAESAENDYEDLNLNVSIDFRGKTKKIKLNRTTNEFEEEKEDMEK